MHPHLSAKAWRAGRHRGNVQNAEASVAHLSTPGPSKGQAVSGRATPPAPCFAIGLLTARTGKGLAAPFAGPPPGKSDRGPIHILQWTSAAAMFWNRRRPVLFLGRK